MGRCNDPDPNNPPPMCSLKGSANSSNTTTSAGENETMDATLSRRLWSSSAPTSMEGDFAAVKLAMATTHHLTAGATRVVLGTAARLLRRGGAGGGAGAGGNNGGNSTGVGGAGAAEEGGGEAAAADDVGVRVGEAGTAEVVTVMSILALSAGDDMAFITSVAVGFVTAFYMVHPARCAFLLLKDSEMVSCETCMRPFVAMRNAYRQRRQRCRVWCGKRGEKTKSRKLRAKAAKKVRRKTELFGLELQGATPTIINGDGEWCGNGVVGASGSTERTLSRWNHSRTVGSLYRPSPSSSSSSPPPPSSSMTMMPPSSDKIVAMLPAANKEEAQEAVDETGGKQDTSARLRKLKYQASRLLLRDRSRRGLGAGLSMAREEAKEKEAATNSMVNALTGLRRS